MDIERGNIEILFKKINYMAIGRQSNGGLICKTVHNYKNIDKKLYMRGAETVFINMTENERDNSYQLACKQMKDVGNNYPSVFCLITLISKKLLKLDGDEIRCRFEQMFRWREISFLFGQDFFTCAYLANYDLDRGLETKCFTWLPIIRSDNDRINNILKGGVAENHFHLAGSTKVFELNWISLMNQIDGRLHDFKKINRTLQEFFIDPPIPHILFFQFLL